MNDNRDMLQNALVAIERLQSKLKSAEQAVAQPIAIVGSGLRYPGGVSSLDDFHDLLQNRTNAVRKVPEDRWDADAYYSPDPNALGKIITRQGGFLDQIDQFDPGIFGISPREAKSLDPQHRLLLETAHEAMESAAIAPDGLVGSHTGVFVGISTNEYARLMYSVGVRDSDVYSATGGALNAAAGRISFTYGFNGPCVAVDTACSSSLNAIHLACQSLRRGESDLALAGGVAVIALPDAMVLFSRWGMLSPDGACKTFDASANGFARAEGCGMIALKRLSDAQADGNPILGVIAGTATNSDGRSSGMTVPNGPAQERMLESALADAKLQPLDIDYVEAHGTGTPIGDPIEMGALGAVLCAGRGKDNPLRVGSLKTNIGHTEAAAGVGGVLKVIASMKAETLMPQLHFNDPNPEVDWAGLPLRVVSEAEPWPRRDTPRRAGVSAFGFSGTNVHVILEDAPAETEEAVQPNANVLFPVPFSAGTEGALRDMAQKQSDFLSGPNAPAIQDLARTLAEGRSHLHRRAALVVRNAEDLKEGLKAIAEGRPAPGVSTNTARTGAAPRIAFLCTGQGSQYAGMSRGLYEAEPVFRDSINRSNEILADSLSTSLIDVLFPDDAETSPISETAFTQPALFAVEYAMAQLLQSWGVRPSMVLGHSIGEYVAACLAGVMSHEDALLLVAERGRLMQQLPAGGAMAAVFAPEDDVAKAISGKETDIAIAGINAPEETVISGTQAAVDAIISEFEARGISSNRLTVSHAFHSPLLDPMLDPFESFAAKFKYRAPRMPLISNLTGAPFDAGKAPDAAYWRDHARGAVRFADCVAAVEAAGADILVEVGPNPALLGLAARARPEAKWLSVPTLRRGQDDAETTLRAVSEVYTAGVDVDWTAVYNDRGGRLIAAPTYPFQRERYWFDEPQKSRVNQADLIHPLLGEVQMVPPPGHSFLNSVSATNPPYLVDHSVLGHVIFPATGYLEMGLAAAGAVSRAKSVVIKDLRIDAPLTLPDQEVRAVHTEMAHQENGGFNLTIREIPEDTRAEWKNLAHMVVSEESFEASVALPTVAEARNVCHETADIDQRYSELVERGLQYGPAFRGLTSLKRGDGIALGTIDLSETLTDIDSYRLHPALLDSAFHAISSIVKEEYNKLLYLPIGIDAIHWHRAAGAKVNVVARLREQDDQEIVVDLVIENETGDVVAQFSGLRARVVTDATLSRVLADEKIMIQNMDLSWEEVQRGRAEPDGKYLVLGTGGEHSQSIADLLGARLVNVQSLAEVLSEENPDWVIDCTALEASGEADAEAHYSGLLSTVQVLESTGSTAGLCVLTQGARGVGAEEIPNPELGPIAGLCHTIDVERRTGQTLLLDLDPYTPIDRQAVVDALAQADVESELAHRSGGFFAPRLNRFAQKKGLPEDHRQVLRVTERGDLDRLELAEERRTAPQPGEVEIAVRAAGLNFRDVLNALGMYPGDPGAMGSECSGVITRVGDGVSDLKPGDPVIALAGDCFTSHVTVSDRFVLPKPESITFADAVTIPNTYLTAALCYETAGGLKPGQRVLVHAAAGGVGLAALRLALQAGAEVIATAGSDEKRAFVLDQGASYAFNSRSADFGDQVLEVTGGEGVDVVINALSGDMIDAGMRATRSDGAFIEIGKNNIWTPEEAAERAPHVRYTIVDLGEQILEDPASVRRSFEEIMSDIETGALAPLPVQAFPLDEAQEAFRFMANARHTGKIAILPAPDPEDGMSVRSDGSYLVTGGLAGIGLVAAERLAARGAGEVVLIGRSGASAEAQETAERLAKQYGTRVRSVACDVSDEAELGKLWANLEASALPVRGIIHGAGVLDDAPLAEQNRKRFAHVAGPKVAGARNLLNASRRAPIDFIVFYSSSSAVLGSPGQANYAGANATLDSLAHAERARGRPVTSIAWGAWGEVGMAARLSDAVRERWKRVGLGQLSAEDALDELENVLSRDVPFAMIASMDPALIAAQGTARVQGLLGYRKTETSVSSSEGSEHSVQDLLSASPEDRPALLLDFVKAQVARVLGYSADALDADQPFSVLGFDSLMAVQIRNSIRDDLGVDLPMRDLLGDATASTTAAVLGEFLNDAALAGAGADDEEWEEGLI